MGEGAASILIVEDDDNIADLLREQLEFESYDTRRSSTGDEALRAVAADGPDLVILDLGLPDQSGFEVCRELGTERPDIPLLVLTARTDTADKVRALDFGADDYLTKPFELVELLARVRALLRRGGTGSRTAGTLSVAGLAIDTRRRTVSRDDVEVNLTAREFDILVLLASSAGEVVSRDELLEKLWPGVFVTPRTVDVHIASLRKKLETDPDLPRLILSVRGVGYRLGGEVS